MNHTKKDNIEKIIFFHLLNQTLCLLPQKAIYWQEARTLLLADLHIGKAAHFRKAGIPIPSLVHNTDIKEIKLLYQKYEVQKVVLLGDLFHSKPNEELNLFFELIQELNHISWELVIGNHDVWSKGIFEKKLIIHEKIASTPPFILSHEPLQSPQIPNNSLNLCGHLHPSIRLKEYKGIAIPCFWFSENRGILPAFGKFTDNKSYPFSPNDQVFGIIGNSVIKIQ
jgi:DNA ligase-associated metallophosphoesterase